MIFFCIVDYLELDPLFVGHPKTEFNVDETVPLIRDEKISISDEQIKIRFLPQNPQPPHLAFLQGIRIYINQK